MARMFRAAVALALCLAAMFVFAQMAALNEWDGVIIRAPVFALAAWAGASTPKSRAVVVLLTVSLIGIGGAMIAVFLPDRLLASHPYVLNTLGAAGLSALGAAVVLQAWLTLKEWRTDRARLRARSKGRLERLSGGF